MLQRDSREDREEIQHLKSWLADARHAHETTKQQLRDKEAELIRYGAPRVLVAEYIPVGVVLFQNDGEQIAYAIQVEDVVFEALPAI